MPFVRIDLFEGRTLEQKKALAKEVEPTQPLRLSRQSKDN